MLRSTCSDFRVFRRAATAAASRRRSPLRAERSPPDLQRRVDHRHRAAAGPCPVGHPGARDRPPPPQSPRPDGAPTSKDRRRFSYDAASELCMSDVMQGPTVLDADDRRRHKTYLIALLFRSRPSADDPGAHRIAENGAIRESRARASRTKVRNRQWINVRANITPSTKSGQARPAPFLQEYVSVSGCMLRRTVVYGCHACVIPRHIQLAPIRQSGRTLGDGTCRQRQIDGESAALTRSVAQVNVATVGVDGSSGDR